MLEDALAVLLITKEDYNSTRLQLGLFALPVRLDGLHEPESCLLDLLFRVVPLLLALLVLALQAFQEGIEIFIGLFHLGLLFLNRRLQVGDGHAHEAIDLLLVLSVTEVQIGRTAARP